MLQGISAQGCTSVSVVVKARGSSGLRSQVSYVHYEGISCKYGGWVLDAWPSGPLEISVNDLISSLSYFLLNLARMDFVIFN